MAARSDSDTDQSASGSAGGVAGGSAGSVSGAAGTGAAGASDLASSYTRTEDVGGGERYTVSSADHAELGHANAKRTYDLHQTLDTDSVLNARREQAVERERTRTWDDRENQMRLRHAETEFNQRVENARAEAEQRLRHYEDMHTMRYGVAGEMVEAIANRVWEKCPWSAPAK